MFGLKVVNQLQHEEGFKYTVRTGERLEDREGLRGLEGSLGCWKFGTERKKTMRTGIGGVPFQDLSNSISYCSATRELRNIPRNNLKKRCGLCVFRITQGCSW